MADRFRAVYVEKNQTYYCVAESLNGNWRASIDKSPLGQGNEQVHNASSLEDAKAESMRMLVQTLDLYPTMTLELEWKEFPYV
jgi:hypothetical protein